MKLKILVLAFLIATVPVTAHEAQELNNVSQEDLDIIKEAYNNNLDNIPGIMKTMVGNERAELVLEGNDISAYAVTEDGSIQELSLGSLDDPTIRIILDHEAQHTLLAGDIAEVGTLYEEDHIKIESVGFVSGVKVRLVKTALFFRGLFT